MLKPLAVQECEGWIDEQMDGRTDGPTDRPTWQSVESRVRDLQPFSQNKLELYDVKVTYTSDINPSLTSEQSFVKGHI